MLTDEQINDHWREANRRDDSWMPQIHWRFARAIEAAAVAPLLERIAALETLSVTHIMTSINPGWDGMGEEVYAKSVSDVEDKLSKMGQELEEWQLGIKRHSEMEARIAELESQLAAAAKDAERMDWLDAQNAELENDAWVVLGHDTEAGEDYKKYWVGSDLRSAIDAAIAEDAKK